MNVISPITQGGIYIFLSIFVGLLFNGLRSDSNSISIRSQPLQTIQNEQLLSQLDPVMIIRSITIEQARNLFNEGILFVDAREITEYEDGHIPGALTSDDYMDLTMTIDEYQGKSKPIVAYCDGGECAKSEDLAYDLQESGFSTIYIFLGGWSEWTEQGFEIEK